MGSICNSCDVFVGNEAGVKKKRQILAIPHHNLSFLMIMGVERNLNKQAGLAVHKDKDHQLRFSVQPNMQALVHILVLAHFCLFIFPSWDVRGNEFDKCVHILMTHSCLVSDHGDVRQ